MEQASGEKNKGYFTSITSNGTTYDSSNKEEKTGNDLFKVRDDATVRLLTLPEINRILGRKEENSSVIDVDSTSTISTTEDSIGLFRLDQLSNITGMKSYSNGYYWLASPWPRTNSYDYLCYFNYYGEVGISRDKPREVRPVVCLTTNVKLEDIDKDGVLEIIK